MEAQSRAAGKRFPVHRVSGLFRGGRREVDLRKGDEIPGLGVSGGAPPRLSLGAFPTAVERVAGAPGLWVKRDDAASPVYGGNKVRKLEYLLARAEARGKRRVVTMGAAGSHHVLATAVFARARGLAVTAVITSQPRTEHAAKNLRASVGLGVEVVPAWEGSLPLQVLAAWGPDAEIVPLGGSSPLGALGYVDAARELAAQIRAGECEEPEVCVVAAGSGGTAAGLAVGFALERLRTRVIGVSVARPVFVVDWGTRFLASRTAALVGADPAAVAERIAIDGAWVGRGYGHATEAGASAHAAARAHGLALDVTYTEKAFAAALAEVGRGRSTLYWHSLSSAPFDPLLRGAPAERALPAEVRSRLA
jgi:1-aminocyclopropane-1-carboxylate deaminase/D-cysteine desulfhydrase-like pyridoxal-dependent ACC family enzyme